MHLLTEVIYSFYKMTRFTAFKGFFLFCKVDLIFLLTCIIATITNVYICTCSILA